MKTKMLYLKCKQIFLTAFDCALKLLQYCKSESLVANGPRLLLSPHRWLRRDNASKADIWNLWKIFESRAQRKKNAGTLFIEILYGFIWLSSFSCLLFSLFLVSQVIIVFLVFTGIGLGYFSYRFECLIITYIHNSFVEYMPGFKLNH